MMQLICSGHKLDLYENTELQFTEDNPLFAFDKVKCERTTNFKLPATPANDRVFALARIPAYAGEGMRRKFAAQLQMGTIVKDGYLYVSSWSGKEYEAIFVTGEMVGLQRIKDAGKLKDLIQESDRLIWNEANTHGANSAAGRAKYAITRYKTDAALCLPSFDLADIIEDASFGIVTPSLQLDKRNWRIIAPEAEPIDERQVTMEFLGTGADPSSDISNPQLARSANISGLSWLGSYASQTILVFVNNAQRYYAVRQFVCGQDIMLTFPEDFSDDIFLMSFGTDAMYNTLKTEYFLGGYSFANNTTTGQGIVRHGTPLAKKSVRINARTPFTFVQASDYDYNRNAPQVEGFRWLGFGNITASFKVEGIEAKEGDYVMLHDILPDITLADALKVYAYLRGEQLYYTNKDGVQFDDLFFISWPRFDISKRLLSIGKVTRTFSDYAQHNLVQFDSANDVPHNTRVITEYTLDNDNINETKEVGKIPFNEGEIDAADGVIVARFDAEDVEKNTLPKFGIAVAGQSQYMERVQLPKNAGIQALCDASTQVEVQARMSAYEYAQITAKTRILCRGTEYVWTSRSWQKDTAKFVLSKLPPLNYYGLTAEARAEIESAYGFDVLVNTYLYLRENPSASSYINEYPLDAALYGRAYIQDGLILQLDRGFGCGTGSWQDFIANIIYTGNNINIVDNAPVFNGSSSYYAGAPLNSSYDNCTIEIVFKRNNNNTCMIFCDGNTSRGLIIVYSGGKYTTCTDSTPTAVSNVQVGAISILSSAKDVRYENGSLLPNSGTDYWGGRDQSYIGGRVTDGVLGMPFSGSIYTIRIYNRLLSISEILANQAIDEQRFL